MSHPIIVENEFITVIYNTEGKYIHYTFLKPVEGQPFRDALNAGLDAMTLNGAHKWLSDNRKYGVLTPEDAEFGVNDWGKRAAKAGWKYWALVVPEDIAGRESMTQVVEIYHEMGVKVMVFTDLEKAKRWLLKQ